MNLPTQSIFDLPLSGPTPLKDATVTGYGLEPLDFACAGFTAAPPIERAQVFGGPAATEAVVVPTPVTVPKRRRMIAGMAIIVGMASAGFWMWSSTLQHVALGIVTGESITISTEAEGLVQVVHTDVGRQVKAGDVLLTLENLGWRDELARFQEELRTAEAEAAAAESALAWQQEVGQDGRPRALSEYHEALGRLRDDEARLESLELTYSRLLRLKDQGTASAEETDRIRLSQKGQLAKVAELQLAVKELKSRIDLADRLIQERATQIRPKHARVEFLRGEVMRCERRISRLQIRAPVDGVILARFHRPGEWIQNAEGLFSLLKAESQEVIFYVPQSSARGFERLTSVAFHEESHGVALRGKIVRVDPQLCKAPESIATFYHRHEPLVAVHVARGPAEPHWPILPMDGIVRLPWLETVQSPALGSFNLLEKWR